jgi:hypothetical protein
LNNKKCSLARDLSPNIFSNFFKAWKIVFGANQVGPRFDSVFDRLGLYVSLLPRFLCRVPRSASTDHAPLAAVCCRSLPRAAARFRHCHRLECVLTNAQVLPCPLDRPTATCHCHSATALPCCRRCHDSTSTHGKQS